MAIDPLTTVSAASAIYPIAKDVNGSIYAGVDDLNPWIKHPVRGSMGLLGWIGGEAKVKEKRQRAATDQSITNFMQNPNSRFVNPQLLARAQRAAAGGMGRDANITNAAHDWLRGEGGIAYDTNLANQMLRGDIPPAMAAAMDRRIGNRFNTLRRNQGGQLARSGILNSSAGGRLMADTYTSERDALANAYLNTMMQRQQLGANLLGRADASRQAYQRMGLSALDSQAARDLAYQQLGFNVLSDADRRNYARETFGLNAQLGVLGQQQARGDATLGASANILGNLYTTHQDQQRFDQQLAQQDRQFNQLLNLSQPQTTPPTGQRTPISPIQAKADASAATLWTPQGGGGNILGSRNPFELLNRRTGAGAIGTPPNNSRHF